MKKPINKQITVGRSDTRGTSVPGEQNNCDIGIEDCWWCQVYSQSKMTVRHDLQTLSSRVD